MSEGARRSKHATAFRGEVSEREEPGDVDEKQIVVHVHVHRDGKPGAGVAERQPKRKVRPTLSGTLFDWRSHYLPVAARNLEAIKERPAGRLQGLAKLLRGRKP